MINVTGHDSLQLRLAAAGPTGNFLQMSDACMLAPTEPACYDRLVERHTEGHSTVP